MNDPVKISLIAAMGESRVIGSQGKIPWHLPADFLRFKNLTMGHPVIMGRKTMESIGRPLPGRTNIVVTTQNGFEAKGCLIAGSLDEALRFAGSAPGAEEVFVIGGEQIYKLALPKANVIYLTKVHGAFDGDAFFPDVSEAEWQLTNSELHKKDAQNQFDYTFCVYERKK